MLPATNSPSRPRRRVRYGLAALALGVFAAFGAPAQARGPEGIADVAEKVIDAVVRRQSRFIRGGILKNRILSFLLDLWLNLREGRSQTPCLLYTSPSPRD